MITLMEKNAKIYIAGHKGLIGNAVVNALKKAGYANLVMKSHDELELTRQADVESFFQKEKPDFVILAAARVGGIQANISYPAQFLYDNICMQANVINSSFKVGIKKLLFFGSACSYPRECPQPIKEEYLLSGYLEPTNEAYAVAKITGIKMCQAYNRQYGTNFICAILTNTYGPGDNFDPLDSHVIPALIRKFHEAKIKKEPAVTIWGTGKALREFIYVDDVADACFFLMQHYNGADIVNIGTGQEISVKDLAYLVKEVVSFSGRINFDVSKPDGAARKVLDVTKLKDLGWQATTLLRQGIKQAYEWYINHEL